MVAVSEYAADPVVPLAQQRKQAVPAMEVQGADGDENTAGAERRSKGVHGGRMGGNRMPVSHRSGTGSSGRPARSCTRTGGNAAAQRHSPSNEKTPLEAFPSLGNAV